MWVFKGFSLEKIFYLFLINPAWLQQPKAEIQEKEEDYFNGFVLIQYWLLLVHSSKRLSYFDQTKQLFEKDFGGILAQKLSYQAL